MLLFSHRIAASWPNARISLVGPGLQTPVGQSVSLAGFQLASGLYLRLFVPLTHRLLLLLLPLLPFEAAAMRVGWRTTGQSFGHGVSWGLNRWIDSCWLRCWRLRTKMRAMPVTVC